MRSVQQTLESIMRWIPEQPVSIEAPVQVAYQQAIQLERIAGAVERIANALEGVCPECEGSGVTAPASLSVEAIDDHSVCARCHGSGEVHK